MGAALDLAKRWTEDLELLQAAASAAADAAMGHFRQSPEVWWKDKDRSPVTAADYEANEVLYKMLQAARPDYGWLSEETEDAAERLSKDTLFIVDPIDGTRAFMAGRETWCVSAAVVHKGRPVAGVLVAPALGETYAACVGGQATKNGEVIACGDESGANAIAATEKAFATLPEELRKGFVRAEHIPSLAYRIAMVADGRLAATLVKPNSHEWDLAAADIILEQAGGTLRDLHGNLVDYNQVDVAKATLTASTNSQISLILEAIDPAIRH